ncbi:MAG: BrnT family toxin [Gammaproteobacteria bacterium]|nr:BrnT family toxin [Gammaproteobacteria bacterium]
MDVFEKLGVQETDFRLVFGRSQLDFDPNKELINRKKHGYSLASAVDLLARCMLPISLLPFITSDPFKQNGEIRHMHMGVDDSGNVVFMVTTMRDDETVRVISFRRADQEEQRIFGSLTGYNKSLAPTR